ncbi:hypothetical protein JXA88_00975 [Candidatus Fermentibacteria bacterium]|nr:hypothetical protein [Candidatus Fermentibacteria bacterium]
MRSLGRLDQFSPARVQATMLLWACLITAMIASAAYATPPLEWSLQDGRDAGYRSVEDVNVSHAIAPRVDDRYVFATNYNYLFELRQIAQFLQVWQVIDPASPDFGGMIEAEAGALADVIQTDNTLEAIIAWCLYAVVFGDTATYGENVRTAWEYCWRYPAWLEEGSAGDDYYRNHNCAWGAWAALTYEEAYGDPIHASYADTCAAYMIDHPMSFNASGAYRWINPFVTGWMAGNLYFWGETIGSAAVMDTAVGMGNRVREWIEADPITRLSEERWAMSSGTAVWGVCNSTFRADPAQGTAWVAEYGPLMDTFQPWRNAPDDGYDWDNAWNVAYANAHHAMYLLSGVDQYGANFQALTDTLLSYDTDDDGGIPATTMDPPTEDMTWVSSYLWLMGVHNLATHLPDIDVGVWRLWAEAARPPFHVGDSLIVHCTFANFGRESQEEVIAAIVVTDPTGGELVQQWNWSMAQGENIEVTTTWPLPVPGTYQLTASAGCPGDEDSANDELSVSVEVVPVVQVAGILESTLTGLPLGGRITAAYLLEGQDPAPYDTCWAGPDDGRWVLELPEGQYFLAVEPRLPYPEHAETLLVAGPSLAIGITFDRVADMVLVDDDDGENIETFLLQSCDTLGLVSRHWDRATDPVPSTTHLLEFPTVPVVWLTGEATALALEAGEQDSLAAFLQGGGMLLLTGQNAVEFCGDGVLFEEWFPVAFASNTFDHILDLDSSDPFNSGYVHIGTAGFGSANNQRAQDVLALVQTPGVDAFPFASYSPGSVAGIWFDGMGARRILLGFGLEGVGLPSQPQGFMPRHVLLGRSLAWLAGEVGIFDADETLPRQPVLCVGPNPARDLITLTYWSPSVARTVRFHIYDAGGRRVAACTLQGESRTVVATFNTSGLASGHYLCRAGTAAARPLVILR